MSQTNPTRRIARIVTLLLSSCLLSVAAPAVSQARSHHHYSPAAGHTAPYTRSAILTPTW